MAVTNITVTAFPETGFNVTDATYQATGIGSGNGVAFPYGPGDVVYLKNDTGGSATFSFLIGSAGSEFTDKGITIPAATEVVADGKTHVYKLSDIFKNNADGKVTIECTVAGKVMVLASAC